MIDADDAAYRSYRGLVDARFDPKAVDRSDDRVRVARFDDTALDALRALLARVARLERALVPATSRLAAAHDDAAAMALSTAAAAAATRLDGLVTYWDRVVDPEEHARGNDPTGLDTGRWLDDPPALDRLDDAVAAVDTATEPGAPGPASTATDTSGDDPTSALADRLHQVEALLVGGLYDLLGVVADGDGAAPGLPGLAESVDHSRKTLQGVALAVAGTDTPTADDPLDVLRSAVPDVPGVAVDGVTTETVSAYKESLRVGRGDNGDGESSH